ncbi:MAG TPA: hypothetical protein VIM73_09570 [Polyangiaceae bacterium]
MNPRLPEPLSAETKLLLAKERAFLPQSAEFRHRALARARAALAKAGGVSVSYGWTQRARRAFLGAAPVCAFAALSFAAAQEWGPFASSAPPSDQVSPANAPSTPRAPKASGAPVVEALTPSEESAPRAAEPSAKAVTPASKPRNATPVDSEALELRLLQRARSAIARGDHAAALTAVTEHQRRFPSGRFREECEALGIKALAGLGRGEHAQRAAEGFKARFPRSVLLPRVEESVRQRP